MRQTTGHALMVRLLGIFALSWLGVQGAYLTLGYFFPRSFGPSVLGAVIVASVAASFAGSSYARRTDRRPTGAEILVFALLATLIAFALRLALLWGLLRFYRLPLTLENLSLIATGDRNGLTGYGHFLGSIVAFESVLIVLMCWFWFWLGARSEIKNREKRAAKAAR